MTTPTLTESEGFFNVRTHDWKQPVHFHVEGSCYSGAVPFTLMAKDPAMGRPILGQGSGSSRPRRLLSYHRVYLGTVRGFLPPPTSNCKFPDAPVTHFTSDEMLGLLTPTERSLIVDLL